MDKFQSFLEQLWDVETAPLIESIQSVYGVIFEASILPEITLHDGEGELGYHEYMLSKDAPDSKVYSVGSVDKNKKPIIMDVQFRKLPAQAVGSDFDDIWLINFVRRGQQDFNVTNDGSLDAFNSVFSAIKLFTEAQQPEGVYFKATDDNDGKAAQKSRIYAGYLTRLGYTKVPPKELRSPILRNGEIYLR